MVGGIREDESNSSAASKSQMTTYETIIISKLSISSYTNSVQVHSTSNVKVIVDLSCTAVYRRLNNKGKAINPKLIIMCKSVKPHTPTHTHTKTTPLT